MKTFLVLALAFLSVINVQAKTSVENNIGQYVEKNSATITLTGEEAKKLWDFLSESLQYSGSFVSEDAGMGKFYLSAPGIKCRALNEGHLEPDNRNLDKIYSCTIEFGSNGAIKL